MIYHHPFPIPMEGTSGSKVRIAQMVTAFRNIGYEVELVSGYAKERKEILKRIFEETKRGRVFDFAYSESSTAPSLISKRNILNPLLDYHFFSWCRNHSIPIGLYFRDIHWKFGMNKFTPRTKHAIAVLLYWYDWLVYLMTLDFIFLQSLQMKYALLTKWPENRLATLPPGCHIIKNNGHHNNRKESLQLKLFYVGGVTPPLYDLRTMINAVSREDDVVLTICCRRDEWKDVQSYYKDIDFTKTKIVHVSGKGLNLYYQEADVFLLMWRQNPYLDFVLPVKLFESIGHGVPILTTKGTESGRFVEKEKIGWVISLDKINEFLSFLKTHPDEITAKRNRVDDVRETHTWEVRARTVVETLSRIKDYNSIKNI